MIQSLVISLILGPSIFFFLRSEEFRRIKELVRESFREKHKLGSVVLKTKKHILSYFLKDATTPNT